MQSSSQYEPLELACILAGDPGSGMKDEVGGGVCRLSATS